MAVRAMLAAGLALALSGCLSLGPKTPEQLLTLTPVRTAQPGAGAAGAPANALAVIEPSAPQRVAVTRVPVQIDESSVAYLQDAMWVERPTRLFQRLLSETIRARGDRLVVDDGDLQYSATTRLTGQLVDLGYDVRSGSVVARYSGILETPDGQVRTRHFESVVPGVAAEVASVGPALNQAANQVASDVAEWVSGLAR